MPSPALTKKLELLLTQMTTAELAEICKLSTEDSSLSQKMSDRKGVRKPSTPRKKRTVKPATSDLAGTGVIDFHNPPPQAVHVAPARPLNSWMAFRSFYSQIFQSLPQKTISGFLTRLWKNDPFHAKWAIVAKAYSTVRESNSKAQVPLESFLAFAVPKVGLIPRDEYLSKMGWVIEGDKSELSLSQHVMPDITSFANDLKMTTLSPQEIVTCYYAHVPSSVDLVRGDDRLNDHSERISLASSPAFVLPSYPDTPQSSLSTATPPASTFSPLPVSALTGRPTLFSPASSTSPQIASGTPDQVNHSQLNAAYSPQTPSSSLATLQPLANMSLAPGQNAFLDQFDPYNTDILSWNPVNGEGTEDAFAMSLLGTEPVPSDIEIPTFDIEEFFNSGYLDTGK